MSIISREKLFHHSKASPREEILQKLTEHGQAVPSDQPEEIKHFLVRLYTEDITSALQYALNFQIDVENFSRLNQRIVSQAGGYTPGDTLSQRVVEVLIKISKNPELHLNELLAQSTAHR